MTIRSWLCILGVVSILMASSAEAIELKGIGVVLGGSWMNQDYEYSPGYEFLDLSDGGIPGLVVGAYSSLAIAHQLSASVEAMYIRKGFESTFIDTDTQGNRLGERTEVYSAHYLSVPLTLRFGVNANPVTASFFAGLGTEILLDRGDSTLFDSFDTLALSGHFGVGLAWRRLGLDVRYVRDFTNSVDPAYSLESVRNDGIVATLTYAIWE